MSIAPRRAPSAHRFGGVSLGDALRGGKRYQSDCGSAPNSRFARFRNSRIAAQASVFGGMTRSPASVLVVWRRSIIVRSSFRTSSRKRAWVVTASSVWAIPVKRMLQRFRPTSQRAAGVWGRALIRRKLWRVSLIRGRWGARGINGGAARARSNFCQLGLSYRGDGSKFSINHTSDFVLDDADDNLVSVGAHAGTVVDGVNIAGQSCH